MLAARSSWWQLVCRAPPPPALPVLWAALAGPLQALAAGQALVHAAARVHSEAAQPAGTPRPAQLGADAVAAGVQWHGTASGTAPVAAASSQQRRLVSSSSSSSGGGGGGSRCGGGKGRTVAVGISGGVDSAVAAMLLKEQGYNVVGVFMRNWDEGEEVGNQNCSVERDARDAAAVCRQLGIRLHEADFVSKYWTQVFEEFLAQCARGLTPNPDLACNRHIKFDALLDFADSLGADLVATGHYARLRHLPPTSTAPGSVQLLRGADPHKDQTYFLASVQPQALSRVLFPVGDMCKGEVRQLATERELLPADRRSSAGICFIGRRNFSDFLSQYLPPVPGTFVSVDSRRPLGPCPNLLTVTHGQRPGIGGAVDRMYVVGKDVVDRVVYVCQGRDHPALLTRTALLRTPHWLSPAHAAQLAERGFLRCQYKARYGQEGGECILAPATLAAGPAAATAAAGASPTDVAAAAAGTAAADAAAGATDAAAAGAEGGAAAGASSAEKAAAAAGIPGPGQLPPFQPSSYTRLDPRDSEILPGYLVAHFPQPAAAITPQQAFVMYDGEVCLGSALIALPGQTLHEAAAGGEAASKASEQGCSSSTTF